MGVLKLARGLVVLNSYFVCCCVDKFTPEERDLMRRAAEARRQGKRLRLHDEKGQLVNPYIPLYISKAPCTFLVSPHLGSSLLNCPL